MASVKDIDALLPQTQCGECGFDGCLPYAEALARGASTIDRCPPGGVATVKALAGLLAVDAMPYLDSAEANTRAPALAVIREEECIGCTKCIQACPVDAIIGSAKLMHTVIRHECTGCGLCVEPCPVDCIELTPLPEAAYDKALARERFQARKIRQLRDEHHKQQLYRAKKKLAGKQEDKQKDLQAKQDYILAAMARVKAKQSHE
ncbi:RnfABCDGE type electron transport complex subunit B [Legionella spiritensis]|uniref:RnfABCDGE type electron transport complex subunit B n=1 Tax=Legionella spiritensis TaxID=452 RepID=UPI000F6E9154|nr:RnfABCDGE type electron transport complex subunit B [Legionella spiritensis]VEG91692.1 iron-sulfur cluster binding protein [Legionella spiritensis]